MSREKAPDDASVLDTYGWILFKLGDYTSALLELEKAIENWPNNADLRVHIAQVLIKLEREEEAKEHLDAARAINPRVVPSDLM